MIRKLCSTIAAITLCAALGACGHNPAPEPSSRDIGPPPAYLIEEKVASAKAGESCLIDAAELSRALGRANTKICTGREDWSLVRQWHRDGKVTEGAASACPPLPPVPAARPPTSKRASRNE